MSRGRAERGGLTPTAEQYLSWAARLTLERVGLSIRDLDGQGLAVAGPLVHLSELWSGEIAEMLGITPKLLMRSDHGGASAPMLMAQASQILERGTVDMVLCLGGGSRDWDRGLATSPHGFANDFERPFGIDGPNTKFAMIARKHFHTYNTRPEQLAEIAVAQRYHASLNPNAYLRNTISKDDYLKSKMISDPLRMLDCSIAVDGAAGFLIATMKKARELTDIPVKLLGFGTTANYREGSDVSPDILVTGVKPAAKAAFDMAQLGPDDVSLAHCYDDYSIMALIQLEDTGFCKKGEGGKFVEKTDLTFKGELPLNTSGGLLSAGQIPGAGSFTGVAEVTRQLRGEAGPRQVDGAKVGFMSSFGGVGYDLHVINTAAMVLGTQ